MHKLQITNFLLPQLPIQSERLTIRPGESASSETLNKFFHACHSDILRLSGQVNKLSEAYQKMNSINAAAFTGFNAMMTSLSARASSLALSGQALISMHSMSQVVTGDTTASINTLFGQATLPILSETDLLMYTSADGSRYLPQNTSAYTALGSSAPTDSGWTFYSLSEEFLTDQCPLVVETTSPTGASVGWVKLEVPNILGGLTLNCIELYPCPAFTYHIEAVEYQSFDSGSGSSWTALNLDYLPGYNTPLYSNTYVNNAGPVRLLFTGIIPKTIRFKLRFTSPSSWGFERIKLKHLKFDNSAILKVSNPWGTNVGTASLRGSGTLASLPLVVSGINITVTMSKNDALPTPIINAVHIQSYA